MPFHAGHDSARGAGQPGFWIELCDWLAAVIEVPRTPNAMEGALITPPEELGAEILIPPSG